MKSFTNKKQNSWKNPNICCICNKIFADKHAADKQYFGTIIIIQENIDVLDIVYVIYSVVYLKKIPIVFHNRSNYDYHFIIKELAE